jgi:hypothetical protein
LYLYHDAVNIRAFSARAAEILNIPEARRFNPGQTAAILEFLGRCTIHGC